MTNLDLIRRINRVTFCLFPLGTSLHITGGCFCRTRAECEYSRYWHRSRQELEVGQIWG